MSRIRRDKSSGFIWFIIMAGVLGILYGAYGRGYGVSVSCTENKVIGIERIPPPLLNVIPSPAQCFVDLEVKLGEEVLCSISQFKIIGKGGVVPCNELEKVNDDKNIIITAMFYDSMGNKTQVQIQHGIDIKRE